MTAVPVVVDSLVKAYKLGRVEVQALRGINLKVEAGGMVSIIGPSGSGKTTLLNILGGLDRATAGNVHVGNTVLTDLDPRRLVYYRRQIVGHVFQTLNLIPTLTAAENVELPMAETGDRAFARPAHRGPTEGATQLCAQTTPAALAGSRLTRRLSSWEPPKTHTSEGSSASCGSGPGQR